MKKRCVLVLETDPVARRHLTSLLETWGYEPVVAGSVDESLAVVAHSHFLFSLLGLDLDGAARPVPAVKPGTVSPKIVGRKAAQAAEREAILRALDQTRWNRFQAAKLLNISYRALLYKIIVLSDPRQDFPDEEPHAVDIRKPIHGASERHEMRSPLTDTGREPGEIHAVRHDGDGGPGHQPLDLCCVDFGHRQAPVEEAIGPPLGLQHLGGLPPYGHPSPSGARRRGYAANQQAFDIVRVEHTRSCRQPGERMCTCT